VGRFGSDWHFLAELAFFADKLLLLQIQAHYPVRLVCKQRVHSCAVAQLQ